MGCGASAEKEITSPHAHAVTPAPVALAKQEGNEPEGQVPKDGYTEKWPDLCDPDKEFNLVDYVFCLPEKGCCVANMLMQVDPKKKHLTMEDIRTWKFTINRDWQETKTVPTVTPKEGARDRKCTFEKVELDGKVAFTNKRFCSEFHITETGMEFRHRKEKDRALLITRSLDLEGNVFWKSDGHLIDDLHESVLTVAKWSAENETLEVDGHEVAKVTANEYMCPDFFLACYILSRAPEPEMYDYILESAKERARREAHNKKVMEAVESKGGRDFLKELRDRQKAEEEEREKEKRAAAAARKAPAASGGGGGGGPPPAAKWWVCQKCGWKYSIKPFQGKCQVSRGQTCNGPCIQK